VIKGDQADPLLCLPRLQGSLEVAICNDGRKCEGCSELDTSPDPADPSITRVFGHGARSKKTGKWTESSCWYCVRTFESRYKNRPYRNFKEFYLALGTDANLFQRFNFLLKELIDKCIALGGPLVEKVRMDWNPLS
jgi:hypothetical protein